jgi:hypothetical protein
VGYFGKCGYHAHVADGGGSDWVKSTAVCQSMVLPNNKKSTPVCQSMVLPNNKKLTPVCQSMVLPNNKKSTPVCQSMVLPNNINFTVDLMTPRPKKFSFSLKLLKGFTSSDNSYQTTDYFGSSALHQWNNPTLNMSQYYHFSKEYGGFVGANEGSGLLLLYYRHHYFNSIFFKFSLNNISTHQTTRGLIS